MFNILLLLGITLNLIHLNTIFDSSILKFAFPIGILSFLFSFILLYFLRKNLFMEYLLVFLSLALISSLNFLNIEASYLKYLFIFSYGVLFYLTLLKKELNKKELFNTVNQSSFLALLKSKFNFNLLFYHLLFVWSSLLFMIYKEKTFEFYHISKTYFSTINILLCSIFFVLISTTRRKA